MCYTELSSFKQETSKPTHTVSHFLQQGHTTPNNTTIIVLHKLIIIIYEFMENNYIQMNTVLLSGSHQQGYRLTGAVKTVITSCHLQGEKQNQLQVPFFLSFFSCTRKGQVTPKQKELMTVAPGLWSSRLWTRSSESCSRSGACTKSPCHSEL